ncbi:MULTISPECIES: amino acid ABC transporter substrate-binding protein [Okeania]|uniref:Amino acid ABC transporter substrate-binding protein n=1 Tax=Okeania hirsuta TaxID=1458930 RepID=A0A3N6Q2M0_9CYAN|nr:MULTISPECIES: amino acid ABC transporter substrate-binding protein [Okeania]NET12481.1 amino acid ABC transporter substrate-binding protein [Okeania sp. SIO1H6]NES78108.1 amino acid ABC transporter substrate-binding protein [Okeania sp. SIO1H4]NES89607.1 amino acid ABC transporter substrate-binding protein [Okeania sp. SIO2B9]NET18847.1 amino acid ABC transporter substrate-binding protein [Okeania sp. SIO1H5]NET76873.1 amino acid ABC transporter substrate-binding protein [Okeania sp. SIO1F9
MQKWVYLLLTILLFSTYLTSCENSQSEPTPPGKSRLDVVKERGKLHCGVEGYIPGFSFVDKNGNYSGIDVDICKAVAAALFNDQNAIEYRNLDSTERFTALNGGEVDMLSRNTAWTVSRDTTVGLEFAPTTFYDGQGMMVRADSGIKSLKDLEGKSICVEAGTTRELILSDNLLKRNIQAETLTFQQADSAYAAYAEEGRCDGITSDKSQLLGRRSTLPNSEQHIILNTNLSKEPLSPATKNNDSAWFDVIKWVIYALIEAEELGITQANVDENKNSDDPTIRRFLGVEGNIGEGLGLSNDFVYRVIKQVGNYGEIYDRNLGKNSPFKLPRGQNNLWTNGGLLYSPPFR